MILWDSKDEMWKEYGFRRNGEWERALELDLCCCCQGQAKQMVWERKKEMRQDGGDLYRLPERRKRTGWDGVNGECKLQL